MVLEKYYTKRTIDDLIFYTHGDNYYNHLLAIAGHFYNFDYKSLPASNNNWTIYIDNDWLYLAFLGNCLAEYFNLAFHQNDIDQMKNYFNKLLELGCFA